MIHKQRPRSRLRVVFLVFLLACAAIVAMIIASIMSIVAERRRMDAGDYPLADTTQATINGLDIRIDRYLAHPILAEYNRVLTIRPKTKPETVFDMDKDPGGGALITVCEISNGRIRLFDMHGSYVIEPDGSTRKLGTGYRARLMPDGTLKPIITPDNITTCIKPLGTFDANSEAPNGSYGYWPAQAR